MNKVLNIIIILISFPAIFIVSAKENNELIFISDIQQPNEYEYVLFDNSNNERATQILFKDIIETNPALLFFLGDIVSFGYYYKSWEPIDIFLNNLKKQKIDYHALLGNHEYTIYPKQGLDEFKKRFPNSKPYGNLVVKDSIAVIMLNSNFSNLSEEEFKNQLGFYEKVIDSLETENGIIAIIVACHHPPFTNSIIVHSSKEVQQYFLPKFEGSKKGKLILSGHSHNLELFRKNKKYYVVIGGGGGSTQALKSSANSIDETIFLKHNLRYFYLAVSRSGKVLSLSIKGMPKDLSELKEYNFLKIKID